jgi:hypothetical protein
MVKSGGIMNCKVSSDFFARELMLVLEDPNAVRRYDQKRRVFVQLFEASPG